MTPLFVLNFFLILYIFFLLDTNFNDIYLENFCVNIHGWGIYCFLLIFIFVPNLMLKVKCIRFECCIYTYKTDMNYCKCRWLLFYYIRHLQFIIIIFVVQVVIWKNLYFCISFEMYIQFRILCYFNTGMMYQYKFEISGIFYDLNSIPIEKQVLINIIFKIIKIFSLGIIFINLQFLVLIIINNYLKHSFFAYFIFKSFKSSIKLYFLNVCL